MFRWVYHLLAEQSGNEFIGLNAEISSPIREGDVKQIPKKGH